MKKNTASQKIGAQMVSATDGSAFTGSVTVYVTGDAGTQAIGSVGSGACTHEGNGYHTYAPAQAETNYNLIAFTFIGTGAVPQTVQVQTVSYDVHDTVRLGITALPNAAADAAGGLVISDAGGFDIDNRAPSATSISNMNIVYTTDFATNYSTTADMWNGNLTKINGDPNPAVGLYNAGTHYYTYLHFDTDQNLLSSAITTVNSQTEFVLAEGLTDDDVYNGMMLVITGVAQAERWKTRVTDYVGATKTITIAEAAPWTVDTADEVNIITVPDQVNALPTATAGAAGGVFIAGTNAATTVTTSFTTTFTGNLTGSVGSVATGGITAASIANGAIDAATFAADVDAEARGWLGLASANLDTQLGDIPTVAEFEARTIVAADYLVAADIAGLALETTSQAILTDTGTTLPATLSTIAGYIDTEIQTIITGLGDVPTVAEFEARTLAAADYATNTDLDALITTVGVAGAGLTEAGGTGDQLTALATQASVDTKPTLAQILAGGDVDGYTLEQTLKLCLAALAGKLSGAATTTITIRSADDTADRIVATVDADGNRSAVTLDAAG